METWSITVKSEIKKLLENVVNYMLNIECHSKASLLKAVLDESLVIEPIRIKSIVN